MSGIWLKSELFNLTKDYARSLLTDPKSRKVILVEHPLLPLHIKDIFAKVLFGNLQVCSVSSYLGSLFKTQQGSFCIVCLEPSAFPPLCRSHHRSCD